MLHFLNVMMADVFQSPLDPRYESVLQIKELLWICTIQRHSMDFARIHGFYP